MNKKAWDALPDPYKAMIETAGEAQSMYTYAETEATQFDVMAEMRDKYKVVIKRWDDKSLTAFEKGWLEVIRGRVGEGPALQEGRRSLPRLPQEVCDLGRIPGHEAHLPRQVGGAGTGAARSRAGRLQALRRPDHVVVDRVKLAGRLAQLAAAREHHVDGTPDCRSPRSTSRPARWRTLAARRLPETPCSPPAPCCSRSAPPARPRARRTRSAAGSPRGGLRGSRTRASPGSGRDAGATAVTPGSTMSWPSWPMGGSMCSSARPPAPT